ncbi:hypothetical protein ASPZODRAFT_136161 [Penicilliopsis zonata CBS 506.65]|uniref:Checkpoint protein RAD24-like helical bundle domain-containing protein n=1 Tax=Penicilliopsis zonata CBS 506.65 TaxID=1073090 RepID=A0A1L9S962_9EURO|nr:hypothetical protein ASPZODRAFT_136161 [Penicilliopsis zonata CBS 506.65]OJJ43700.1 hypothetical protein ASPZODRAFT_136161 [Penicilliopsis zonata CBS 506.65]
MDTRPAKRQRGQTVFTSDDEIETPVKAKNGSKPKSSNINNMPRISKNNVSLHPTRPRSTASSQIFGKAYPTSRAKFPMSKDAGVERSLHNFFQPATEEERWSFEDSRRSREPSIVLGIEDEDDLIEDDYDSCDEIFTQSIDHPSSDQSRSQQIDQQQRASELPPQTETTFAASRNQASLSSDHFSLPRVPSKKERNPESTSTNVSVSPWSQRYAPSDIGELAVHKKKVSDTRTWLEDAFCGRNKQRLLILKGPAGCGKTTTIMLLSKSIRFEVVEWKYPSAIDYTAKEYVSIGSQFEDFLTRGHGYGGLELDEEVINEQHQGGSKPSTSRRLILIEEFPPLSPSSSSSSPSSVISSFRKSLQRYLAAPNSSEGQEIPPIVLIISETLLGQASSFSESFHAQKLVGPVIYNNPATTVLEFNSIAPTYMLKALDLVLAKESRHSQQSKTPRTAVLRAISELGDIRSAISCLEFLCLKSNLANKWNKTLIKKSRATSHGNQTLTSVEELSLGLITQRESSLGMFHAVGKVVYNKRDDENPTALGGNKVPTPPDHLRHHFRSKIPQVSTNELVNEIGTDIQTFIYALHENYVLSCEGIYFTDCLDECIKALSDSDLLSTDYTRVKGPQSTIQAEKKNTWNAGVDILRQNEVSFQVAVRGLLFALPHPVKRQSMPHDGTNHRYNAFKMLFPTSLRLWNEYEQAEGLIDIWMKQSLNSFGRSIPLLNKSASTSDKSFKSPTRCAGTDIRTSTDQQKGGVDDEQVIPTMVSRTEMLLYQLPYLAKILCNEAESKGLKRLTAFHGIIDSESISSTEGFNTTDELRLEMDASHSAASDVVDPQVKGNNTFGPKTILSTEGGNLVLSDDDIED